MNLAKLIFTIIVCLCLSSCCTQKDCDQDNFPQIVLSYSGINSDDLSKKIIYVIDKDTHEKIDSVEFSNPDNHFVIDKWLMYDIFGDKREFKQYDYLLKLSDRQDSITNIRYERISENVECNSCFPFGDGSATVTDYKDLGFMINQESYDTNDTIFIGTK